MLQEQIWFVCVSIKKYNNDIISPYYKESQIIGAFESPEDAKKFEETFNKNDSCGYTAYLFRGFRFYHIGDVVCPWDEQCKKYPYPIADALISFYKSLDEKINEIYVLPDKTTITPSLYMKKTDLNLNHGDWVKIPYIAEIDGVDGYGHVRIRLFVDNGQKEIEPIFLIGVLDAETTEDRYNIFQDIKKGDRKEYICEGEVDITGEEMRVYNPFL